MAISSGWTEPALTIKDVAMEFVRKGSTSADGPLSLLGKLGGVGDPTMALLSLDIGQYTPEVKQKIKEGGVSLQHGILLSMSMGWG